MNLELTYWLLVNWVAQLEYKQPRTPEAEKIGLDLYKRDDLLVLVVAAQSDVTLMRVTDQGCVLRVYEGNNKLLRFTHGKPGDLLALAKAIGL